MPKQIVRSSVSFPDLSVYHSVPDEPVNLTREDITLLMLESHKKAANSAEEIMALREVAKLNDLYPGSTTKVDVSITHVEKTLKELQNLPTEELLKLAGENANLLELPEPLEGKYREVEKEEVDSGSEPYERTSVMPIEDA